MCKHVNKIFSHNIFFQVIIQKAENVRAICVLWYLMKTEIYMYPDFDFEHVNVLLFQY